jgi:hypothetical protein
VQPKPPVFRNGGGSRTRETEPGAKPKVLEGTVREGENPVGEKRRRRDWDPEYHEARETLWEAGGTTLQG